MSGIRSIHRGPAAKGFATGASAPIRVDDSLNVLKIIPAGSGSVEQTVYTDGTGVAPNRVPKTAILALTGAAVHAGAVGIVNPEGVDLLIVSVNLVLSTHATAANGLVDVGTTTVSITTASDNLMDGVAVGSGVTAPVSYGASDGAGANGKRSGYWTAGKWVTVSDDATADVTGMVATLYINYILV